MTFGSLFSGVGGADLGLERAGMECRWQVEIDQFRRSVLATHWPITVRFEDVTKDNKYEPVDCIVGGFPCQDLSVAGHMRGIDAERSGLWSHFARIIREVRPRYVLIENVSGVLANEPMRRVLGDLSACGYDAEWESIPAAALGAPHIRDRVWILAYPGQERGFDAGGNYVCGGRANVFPKRSEWPPEKRGKDWELVAMVPGIYPGVASDWWTNQSRVDRSVNGIPRELVDARNSSLGDSIVPQVCEWIGRKIIEAEERIKRK